MHQPTLEDSQFSEITIERLAALIGSRIGAVRLDAIRIGALAGAIVALGAVSAKPAYASEPVAPQSVTISQGLPNRNTQILPGEILITGDMLSVDTDSGRIKIRAKSFQNSGGGIATVDKEKIVIVDANSRIYRYGAPDALISLSSISPNDTLKDVQFIGTNLPSNELKAREVILPKDGNEISPSQPKDAKPETIAASLKLPANVGRATQPATPVQPTPSQKLEQLAKQQFSMFGKLIAGDPKVLLNPQFANCGTYIKVSTDNWIYTVDVTGNQTFRPASNVSVIREALLKPPADAGANDPNSDRLIKIARDLCDETQYSQNVALPEVQLKKEILLFGKCGSQIKPYNGRYLVRLGTDPYVRLQFQVSYDEKFQPFRIDTDIQPSSVLEIRKLLFSTMRSEPMSIGRDTTSFTFGSFFSPKEKRFENEVRSYEGYPFKDMTATQNPFNHKYQEWESWNYVWWDVSGRLNGLRGNWSDTTQSWENSGVKIFHKRLDDYQIPGGPGASYHMGSDFYNDLERCTVAVFATHGGTVDNGFQLDNGSEHWFYMGEPDSKFGVGNLRVLIFNSCGAIDLINGTSSDGNSYQSLIQEWMPATNVDGLKLVCGFDGGSSGVDRDGWRFSGYLRKGDSVAMSWILAGLKESFDNWPVVVSYGKDETQVISNQADGGLTSERIDPVYSLASAWRNMILN